MLRKSNASSAVGISRSLLIGLSAISVYNGAFAQKSDVPVANFGPKRTISVQSFEVKLAQGGSSGFTFGGGSGNTAATGSSGLSLIAIPNPADFGSGLSDVMITSLTESEAFTVLEMPPAVEGAPPTVPPVLPQFMMKAVVTEVSCRERGGGLSIAGLGGSQGQYENKVTLDVRLADPTTQVVLESVKATGKKTAKGSIFGYKTYPGGSIWNPQTSVLDLTFADFESSPLAEAARLAMQDAVKKLREKVAKRPWEAAVLKVVTEDTGVEIYINLPGDCGLKVGDKLELCRYGEEILDPKTGQIVGWTKAKVLGSVEVAATDTERVICKPRSELASISDSTDGLFVRFPRAN